MIVPIKWLLDYINTSKSPKELAKSFTEIGLMLDKPIYGEVLNLEHRMDRADWLSITGCARDIAAFEGLKFHFPELKSTKIKKSDEVFVHVKSEKVNRFRTRVIKNVKVGESPKFIQDRLEAYGLPVINNIVDITNFVMVEIGQPLHAQDLDKFEKKEIILRDTKENEIIQTLDGTIIKLPEDTLVLSENNNPICIGGIVGGLRTGVTNQTTNIVLDAGNYNQASIRKTSRKVNIQNETVLRSEKFLSPELVDLAIIRATDLILEHAGGEAFENDNYERKEFNSKEMILTKKRLEQISGEDYYFEKAPKILTSLGYEIIKEDKVKIECIVPHFRTDVEVEDDLVADVIRIHGYSKIVPQGILKQVPEDITPQIKNFENKVTDILIQNGFHEHITDPICKYDGISNRIPFLNSVNSEKNSLRITIKETLKNVLENYQKHQREEIKLFEVGNRYLLVDSNFLEERVIGIIYNLDSKEIQSKKIRKTIDLVLSSLGINYELRRGKDGIEIYVNEKVVGFFSDNYIELFLEELIKHEKFVTFASSELENLSKEDLTFVSHIDFDNGEVLEFISKINPLIKRVEYISEFLTEGSRKVTFRYSSAYPQEMKNIREDIIKNTSLKYKVSFIA